MKRGGFSKQFNPRRLKAARVFRGMTITELADKIGVTRQAVSQFEQGKTSPSLENIFKLTNVLQFPRDFFYAEDKSVDYIGNTFFRSNSTATKRLREAQKVRVDFIFDVQQFLEEYVNFPKLNLPDTKSFDNKNWTNEDIELLAEKVREHWGLGDKPITNMVFELEKNGIFVTTVRTDSQSIDAFCQKRVYNGRDYYFVVLGSDKFSAVRRQFDAAHELGHILMHGWIDDQEQLSNEEVREMERQANYFAAALLLPRKAFSNSLYSFKLEEFINLKKYWMVSINAMIVRSYHMGLINYNQYQYLQKQMSQRKMKTREPFDDIIKRAQPSLFKQSIELLLNNNVIGPEEIVSELKFHPQFIEELVNLPSNMLAITKKKEDKKVISLKVIN
ncbi:helix-turn-helix domain-containing protein [Parageobacillus thermoglucosidasius]|uniref:XRE family transcriptional regulator n=1 Tax=Parageobacillus thermoglucosidasius TaxID=1426 RepID=A0A1B7KP88_PARTM|nr:XRE family transcriptional regulator [Parageobacillus thermoglucosidasius]OAT71898.1 XRE family transcriptional regulator [Parageobacillus thermoglucosidasius]